MPRRKQSQLMITQAFTNEPEMILKLKRLSHQNDVSVSQIIREALRVYFAQQYPEDGEVRPDTKPEHLRR